MGNQNQYQMEIFTISSSWLLVAFIFYIFLHMLRRSSMAVPKLPPNPPKLPIIGNLHQLLGKPHHQVLWELSKQYGPVMQIHIGSKPFIVISSPAMAKQVLKTQDHIFCSRPTLKATKKLTYNFLDIAFSPQSNHRREMRKILVSEFLGPKRAKFFNQVLVMEVETTVRSLALHPSDTVVDLSNVLFTLVKEVVCKAAFGKHFMDQWPQGLSWEEMLDEAAVFLKGSLSDNFPWFGEIFDHVCGWNRKLEKFFLHLDAYIQVIVNEHHSQKVAQVSDDDKDFVHRLIELSPMENASNSQLTDEDTKALIMDVILGGIDTTVVTLVWAMSEITRNDRVMQKLQSEIRNHMGRKQNVGITNMSYLKEVVKETLRIHPPAPLLIPHESLSHCKVGGYDVFPKTIALINAWGIGRDPNTWGENAGDFFPERFENLEVDFEMIPFGVGRRSCPAMNIAPSTIEFIIANLLCWFDWKLPHGVKREDLNMQEEGTLIVRKKIPLCLVPVKYDWED